MQECLYKAKGKKDRVWYVGSYWKSKEIAYKTKEDADEAHDNEMHSLLIDQVVKWGLPYKKHKLDIEPETLCRTTHMKDRNEKIIFEKDILRSKGINKRTYQVCFGEFEVRNTETGGVTDVVTGWYLKPIQQENVIFNKKFPVYNIPLNNRRIKEYRLEVVGNVIDNTELLNRTPKKNLSYKN